MNRRKYLADSSIVIFTLSGCIETMGSDSKTKFPRVSVQPDPVSKEDVKIQVDVINQFSDSGPAKLQIQFTNTGETVLEMSFGQTPPFSTYSSSKQDPGLVLIPEQNDHIHAKNADQIIPDEPSDACWKEQGEGMVVWGMGKSVSLKPGESISEDYTLLAHHRNEPCFQDGEYRFEESNYFDQEGSWGFNLTLAT